MSSGGADCPQVVLIGCVCCRQRQPEKNRRGSGRNGNSSWRKKKKKKDCDNKKKLSEKYVRFLSKNVNSSHIVVLLYCIGAYPGVISNVVRHTTSELMREKLNRTVLI